MNHVIMANHMISLITSSTTDPSTTTYSLANGYDPTPVNFKWGEVDCNPWLAKMIQ